ncbi:MAG: hypothetical protein JJE09_14420 [Bacteroidia bacterium]|nr:hypothetical protein [Bacteroidia bacterium]
MSVRAYNIGTVPKYTWTVMCIFSFFFLFSVTTFAQNTKGDQPVSNQRQVRESKGKTKAQKRNKKPKTKDISGRRLRTKDKSSANRANVGIKQPDPYRGRSRTQSDKAAKPRGKIYSKPPREQNQRAWTGDISGKPIRRIVPSKSGVARNNVYPQRGRYFNNGSPKPKKDKPKVYTRTSSGEFPIKQTPQNKQRAWKGDIKGGPVGTPSRSGQIKNTYKQFGEYGNHPSRKPRNTDRIQSGRIGSGRSLRSSSSPWPKNKEKVNPRSGSQSFLTRGRKNVYWGKYSKSGKAVTTDITGKPLKTRNFRSTPAGLVSRDTLRFFGRRPGGDRASKQTGGGIELGRKGQKAWAGDISGKKLRGTRPRKNEDVGEFFFPRQLSMSRTGEVGKPIEGRGIYAGKRKKKRVESKSLPPRPPGIGGISVDRYIGDINGRRPIKGGGSVSGKRWNNKGEPIDVNGAGLGTIQGAKFRGKSKRGEISGFSQQGEGWRGNIKRGELSPGFSSQGADWAGNKKGRRPLKGGGSISGKQWNNNGEPIDVNGAGSGTNRAGKFQGNYKRGELSPSFSSQGADWAGNKKGRRPLKGGGSVSGKQWNNNGEPIDVNGAGSGTNRAGKFQGNYKRGELFPGFSSQGADWAGNKKARRPLKGGGSVSGKQWNNKGEPIDVNGAGSGTIRGSKFQGNYKRGELSPGFSSQGADWSGNTKGRKPSKGGGSVSGKLWNNNEQAIDVVSAGKGTIGGATFQGNIKTSKPEKGGGSVSGKHWNNNEQAIDVVSAGKGAIGGATFQGKMKTGKPEKGGGSVSGKLWNNNEEPLVKLGAGSGKATARIRDYQGNLKMHKYNDSRLHPDSKFAHSFHDNVKEERTFLINVKLFWSKVFKKSDTQPEHLKEKVRKPRYDKGEEGMWYN